MEQGITSDDIITVANGIGREFVIKAEGEVIERYSKSDKIPTGDIEIRVESLTILNKAKNASFQDRGRYRWR